MMLSSPGLISTARLINQLAVISLLQQGCCKIVCSQESTDKFNCKMSSSVCHGSYSALYSYCAIREGLKSHRVFYMRTKHRHNPHSHKHTPTHTTPAPIHIKCVHKQNKHSIVHWVIPTYGPIEIGFIFAAE